PFHTSPVVARASVQQSRTHASGARSARKRRTESRSSSCSSENSKSTATLVGSIADVRVRKLACAAMRLRYDDADEAFRAELIAWLDEHAPTRELLDAPKPSSAWLPSWAREWQR